MEQAESNQFHHVLRASAARGRIAAAPTLLLSLPRRGRVADPGLGPGVAGWGAEI